MSETSCKGNTKRVMPLWFKIVCSLSFLALVCVTAGIIFTESWSDVISCQLNAIKNEDFDKAYQEYTSEAFRKATSKEEFKQFILSHPGFYKAESAFFTKRSIKDNFRTLRGYLSWRDHEDIPVEYRLIKEDGSWKIQSIRLLKTRKMNEPSSISPSRQ